MGLAVDVIETDQAGDKAAAPTRLGTKATTPAHPILSVNLTSYRSVLHRTDLATPPQPKKLLSRSHRLAIAAQIRRPTRRKQNPETETLRSPRAKAADRLVVAIVDVEAAEAVEAAAEVSSRARTLSKGRLVNRANQASRRVNSRRRPEFLGLSKRSLEAMAPNSTMRLSKSARVVSETDVRSAAT